MRRKEVLKNPDVLEGTWTCTKCKKELSQQSSLLRHMILVHGAKHTKIDHKKMTGTPVMSNDKKDM